MQASRLVSLSPSYSSTSLSEIAARVVEEFTAENETESEFMFNDNDKDEKNEKQVNEDDGEFEFAFVTQGSDQFSPISADEIFYNGQIRPIFNRDLSLNDVVSTPAKSMRVSLRKLFIEDREITSLSSSSSEADDLEGITPGTYCMWRPTSTEETSSELCKKSNSTGSSSKRWKLRDFLHWGNSEGKETFVFLTTKREEKAEKTRNDSAKITGVSSGEGFPAVRCLKNGKDKRKSYLPYRQDLVSFFGNVNGFNRNLQHF
ncbi:unnamed protein product [Withania somnifera]